MQNSDWYRLENAADVPSPAILFYPDRIEHNIRKMLELVGGAVARLRPHVKTHKSPDIIRMQLEAGIRKFKCATIAEMEMTIEAGAENVLLAYQPVGPNMDRMLRLIDRFPGVRVAAVTDSLPVAEALSVHFSDAEHPLRLLVDLDCGMHRTGIEPGDEAFKLCQRLAELPGVEFGGLHVYDGHIHDSGVEMRREHFEEAFKPVLEFIDRLEKSGLELPEIVGGGSPTFALHGSRMDWQCSPGTTLLWDSGYGTKFPDLEFLPAAVLLTRIISKPGADRVCLDLGHKAVAGENPIENRVRFPDLADAKPVMQSEEHLVMETPEAPHLADGAEFYGIPWHICPTVALHNEAVIVRDGRATDERWLILARNRILTI